METMKDIKARFASAKEGEYNALFRHYENDERSGVQKTDPAVSQKSFRLWRMSVYVQRA